MSLWLAIVLPALPLQLAARAIEQPGPVAIVEAVQRPMVAFCNDDARAAGIAPGMKLAAAQALARELIAIERKPEVERDALHELACWAYQFSALISVQHGGLLLETGASERLFGGRAPLHRRIARGLRDLGYAAAFGYAATPRAAWLIGRARSIGIARGVESRDPSDPEHLHDALAPLPLAALGWEEHTTATLHALGLAAIGDVLALPRDAFAKRFGTSLLDDLDHALGTLPDPQPLFAPPEFFDARIELPADVIDAAQLMFPAHRLLRSLEGFLRGRGAGATELLFTARHSARRARPLVPTQIVLPLAAPERDAARLAKLLAERLSRVQLPEPAITLALRVDRLQPFAALNASWLPPAPGNTNGTEWLQLAETLHARLGAERVFQLQLVDDHRPEDAYRIVPLAVDPDERRIPARATPQRPLLLVETPQPLACCQETPDYHGSLALVAGPERIESGWWDLGATQRRTVHRDYFVARNPHGQTLWVFRELAAPRGWFLHGFFA